MREQLRTKYVFQNWLFPDKSVRQGFFVESCQNLSRNIFLINNSFLIDFSQGQLMPEKESFKEFLPAQDHLIWFCDQLVKWACPYVIEGSSKKAKAYIQWAFNPHSPVTLKDQSGILSVNENFTYVPVKLALISASTKKYLYSCVGPEFSPLIDAFLGFADNLFLKEVADPTAHYVVCADIFEDLLYELGQKLSKLT